MRITIGDDWFMMESGKNLEGHLEDKDCLCNECCLRFMLDTLE